MLKTRTKIAFITPTFRPEVNGVSESIYKCCIELAKREDCELLFLVPDYSDIAHLLPDYQHYIGQIFPNILVKTYPTYTTKNIQKISTVARAIVSLYDGSIDDRLEEFQPDLIHIDEPERFFFGVTPNRRRKRVGLAYAKKHHIPIVGRWRTDYIKMSEPVYHPVIHYLYSPIVKKASAWIYNSYDATFCHCTTAQKTLVSWGFNNTQVVIAHHLDLSQFTHISSPNDNIANTNEKQINILFVGRVSHEKNLELLFSAFLDLYSRHKNCQLTIVGPGPALTEYREKYGHLNHIIFTGKIANEELPQHYSKADFFVTPSNMETFGVVTLEAAACSIPVIVSSEGGFLTNENVAREECLIFSANNLSDLIAQMEKLMVDVELRKRMAINAQKMAQRYSTDSVHEFFTTWQKLIALKQATAS